LPQSVEPATSRTHQPPRVRVDSIPGYLLAPYSSLQHGTVDTSQGCQCTVELTVPVIEDDDPLATLEVRWFVDYDPTKPLTQRFVKTELIAGSFDSTAVERVGPRLTFDIAALGVGDGFHVVDVVIAESGGFDPASTALPNRAMKPGYESTGYRFFVNVVPDNATACPNTPPRSTRTCQSDGGTP
jgi:hypothetical protein